MPIHQVELQAGSNQPVTQGHCRLPRHQQVIHKTTAKRLFLCPPHICAAVHILSRAVSVLPSKCGLSTAPTGPKVTLCLYPLYFSLMCVEQLSCNTVKQEHCAYPNNKYFSYLSSLEILNNSGLCNGFSSTQSSGYLTRRGCKHQSRLNSMLNLAVMGHSTKTNVFPAAGVLLRQKRDPRIYSRA